MSDHPHISFIAEQLLRDLQITPLNMCLSFSRLEQDFIFLQVPLSIMHVGSLLQNKEHDSAAEIQSPDTQKRTSHAHLPPPPRATDPTLDFFSPQFDALKALYADLRRPNEWVAPLNTLAQCRFILPEEMRESLAHLQQVSSKTRASFRCPHLCSSISLTDALLAAWP